MSLVLGSLVKDSMENMSEIAVKWKFVSIYSYFIRISNCIKLQCSVWFRSVDCQLCCMIGAHNTYVPLLRLNKRQLYVVMISLSA